MRFMMTVFSHGDLRAARLGLAENLSLCDQKMQSSIALHCLGKSIDQIVGDYEGAI
jgi:hypothetical protein